MLSSLSMVISTLLAITSLVLAQTSTSCNPTNTTCSSDTGLSSKTFTSDFTKGDNSSWTVADYTTITYSDLGAAFTIHTKTDAPTIATDFYIFFGYVEVKMRAANGTGIISSIVLESDDLDEIDWEFLGSYDQSVQTNFYGKGNTTTYNRELNATVSGTTETYHTYALNWTSSSLEWIIDGSIVRTLLYTDAVALGGKNYPQTPCRLKLGSWAGGASASEGTVQWAGGATNFNEGPFTMYVESVSVTNYNPASSYTYSDKSGDYTSIRVDTSGTSNSTTSSSSSSVSPSKSTSTSTSTSTPKSGSVSSNSNSPASSSSTTTGTAVAATTSSTSFVQGSNDASRQADGRIFSNKAVYFVLALAGVFVL